MVDFNLHHLVPVDKFQSGFTVCDSLEIAGIESTDLDDSKLGVHKVTSRTSHRVVVPPLPVETVTSSTDGGLPAVAWEAFYPKGSINPSAPIPGGFGFYCSGTADFASALQAGATNVIVSYRMMLQSDWEWVKGGKLPGIFGGDGDLSYRCTGGRQDDRCKCFNIRPMWRSNGVGELYTYLPLTQKNREQLLAVPPSSKENTDYGFSVGRAAFKFNVAVGKWTTLALRVKVNSIGHEDGEIQLWVDGTSVIHAAGLTLRDSETSKIKGAHFQTFFGGHQDDWASPKDQRAWFADVSGVIID